MRTPICSQPVSLTSSGHFSGLRRRISRQDAIINMHCARWLLLLVALASAKEVQQNEKANWNIDREAAAVKLRLNREALEHIRRVRNGCLA